MACPGLRRQEAALIRWHLSRDMKGAGERAWHRGREGQQQGQGEVGGFPALPRNKEEATGGRGGTGLLRGVQGRG